MVVLARAAPGREDELVHWLTRQHLPDLLRVPGIARARLWGLGPLRGTGEIDYRTLALYDLVGDVGAIVAEAGARMGGAHMPASTALGSPNLSFLARPLTDLRAPDRPGSD